METSHLIEIIILGAILLIGGTVKFITMRKVKSLEGIVGVVKKKNAKGQIIAKD